MCQEIKQNWHKDKMENSISMLVLWRYLQYLLHSMHLSLKQGPLDQVYPLFSVVWSSDYTFWPLTFNLHGFWIIIVIVVIVVVVVIIIFNHLIIHIFIYKLTIYSFIYSFKWLELNRVDKCSTQYTNARASSIPYLAE